MPRPLNEVIAGAPAGSPAGAAVSSRHAGARARWISVFLAAAAVEAVVVLAALGASLALNGSIVGPLLFFVGINLLRVLTRWYGLKFGYERGTEMVTEVGGGQLKKITQMAAIMGLFVMGALVSKWTTIKFPTVVSSVKNDDGIMVDTTVQSILDQLLPGLAALGLTFLCMWLLNKKVNALWIILGMFAVGILGRWTGFLGV